MKQSILAKMKSKTEFPDYDPFGERAQLIEAVRLGRITPAAAEEEADRQGYALEADLKNFDLKSSKLAVWSLEMTAAWIVWRDTPHVLRHFEPSYRHARKWIKNSHRYWPDQLLPCEERGEAEGTRESRCGYDLKKLGATNVKHPFLDIDGRHPSFDYDTTWWDDLHEELVEGRIRAAGQFCPDEWAREKGYDVETSESHQAILKLLVATVTEKGELKGAIPQKLWCHLQPGVTTSGESVIRYQDATLFRNVRFSAAEVMGRFHEDETKLESNKKTKLLRSYKEDVKGLGRKSLPVANWIKHAHPNGFPAMTYFSSYEEVKNIIKCHDKSMFNFEDPSVAETDSFQRFVRRLLSNLCDGDFA